MRDPGLAPSVGAVHDQPDQPDQPDQQDQPERPERQVEPGTAPEPARASSGPSRGLRRTRNGELLRLAASGLTVSVVSAAAVVGAAALTGSTARSVTAGVLAAAVVAGALAAARWRRAASRGVADGTRWPQRPLRPVPGALATLGVAALVALSWALPGRVGARTDVERPPLGGTTRLARPDGTRLALHASRAAVATRPPVVVVHGGPGVADMAHDAPAYAALATDRDVYVYDRVGTGASSRLADPTGYTLRRAVADLEAVRVATGAPEVVLLGHSWGARVATAYAQEHPGEVAALVLSAPGDLPLDGGADVPGDLQTRLDPSQVTRLYLLLLRPRNLFAYALTAADARVAHALAADAEMDARFAEIYGRSTPALFCDRSLTDRVGTAGVGYFAHYVPQLHPDPGDVPVDLRRLAAVSAPVLVVKPACDYLPWSSTAGYRRAFPASRLVLLPRAGHAAHLEQPAAYAGLVRAFLDGRPLPFPEVEGDAVPGGYRGTP
jgi:pimeloyl-ACP methyl ester carboxylesterase